MAAQRFANAVWIILALIVGGELPAAEPWADPRLPVRAGLDLWLDAGSEVAAQAATGKKPVPTGDRLATWHDGSGGQRHITQSVSQKQPKLIRLTGSADVTGIDPGWVVRFDGEDDHLSAVSLNRRLTEFTLFVVAAPHSNQGRYRSFLSLNQTGQRDYETGLNLDMNTPASAAFSNLNLEGKGFGGARNLIKTTVPFGTLHIIDAVGDERNKQVRLAFDSQAAGQRPFAGGELSADEITVGARHLGIGSGAESIQGFLHGDLAEVLLYSRALPDEELQAVRAYLRTKHAKLMEALPRELAAARAAAYLEPLVAVTDPPPVQMLVAFYSSPQLPRLLNPDAIRRTISDGVAAGQLGLATKDAGGRLKLQKLRESLIDVDVDISDDVFILKAEDAQRLKEPPRLATLVIRPDNVVITVGDQVGFECSAIDQYGQEIQKPALTWTATGGTINESGMFTAGESTGLFAIHARGGGVEGVTEVRIQAKRAEAGAGARGESHPPGKRLLRWRRTVPPQKWMNFYTKILSRFASSPDLRLEVSFDVLLDSEQAKGRADETRSGLKELGVEDDVELT